VLAGIGLGLAVKYALGTTAVLGAAALLGDVGVRAYDNHKANQMLAEADDGEKSEPSKEKPKRRPVKEIREEWEELHDKEWPIDNEGKNFEADHDDPLADGGEDTASNITPRVKKDHIRRHKENGDFHRWGSRARTPKE